MGHAQNAKPCRASAAKPISTWPLERVEHLRSVLARVVLQRIGALTTQKRIFPVDQDDKGGL